jgi:hypothetical protein
MADNVVMPETRRSSSLWIAQFSCIAALSINRDRTEHISETEVKLSR